MISVEDHDEKLQYATTRYFIIGLLLGLAIGASTILFMKITACDEAIISYNKGV